MDTIYRVVFMLFVIGVIVVVMRRRSKIAPEYLQWRKAIFSLTKDAFGTDFNQTDQVFGVVCDIGISNDLCISIMSLTNGETSVRSTTGGGMINLGATREFDEASRRIVQYANTLVGEVKPVSDSSSLPISAGQVFFYFMTVSGIKQSNSFNIETLAVNENDPFGKLLQDFMLIKSMTDEKMRKSIQTKQ